MIINTDLIYPIGSIYLTTSSISPQTLFGGTWEKITNDAYLKIANGSTAGNLGGTSSDHKIPLESIPAHNHAFWQNPSAGQGAGSYGGLAYCMQASLTTAGKYGNVSNSGGGQAYYPYYYDVFVWRRTA